MAIGVAQTTGVALLAASFLSGCSDPYRTVVVTGKVTCDGKPATGGTIFFMPMDDPKSGRPVGHPGKPSWGTVGADGTFTLTTMDEKTGPSTVLGPHKIRFDPPPSKRPSISAEERNGLSPEELKARLQEIAKMPIHAPLTCSSAITPAQVEVTSSATYFEFTLRAK
jgi:hypothetical protein